MKVYSTLSGQKEEFTVSDNLVKMYVCGVTPYDESHVGHAMSYIIFDAIKRYLEYRGFRVRHVQNFTDIDDKIINRAQRLGITHTELAERYIQRYFADMDELHIKRADVYPRATQEIEKIVEVVKGLIDKGHAYAAAGDVYFRVASFPEYGKLSRRTLDGMMSGARVEVGETKEHPMDFTLWKSAKPGEPWWESPWSKGRPGWHIECTAMSTKYLGATLDIHGGGQDLIFPHHENEIAQSECFTGTAPFVRFWLHNGLMRLGEDKMSKSLGNLVTVRQMLDKFSADALRLFILSSHYRSPISFSESGVAAMERAVVRLRAAATVEAGKGAQLAAERYREQFIESMDDDFNTAQAVALLFDLARDINRGKEDGSAVGEAQKVLRDLSGVLGLTLEAPLSELPDAALFVELLKLMEKETRAAGQQSLADGIAGELAKQPDTASTVEALLRARTSLRSVKQWALADQIRKGLTALDIAVEDSPQGSLWKYRGKGQVQAGSK